MARSYMSEEVNVEKQEIAQAFASRVQEARVDRGMSVVDLAKHAGISRQSVYAIEKCEMSPSMHMLRRICDALGLKASELLGW